MVPKGEFLDFEKSISRVDPGAKACKISICFKRLSEVFICNNNKVQEQLSMKNRVSCPAKIRRGSVP